MSAGNSRRPDSGSSRSAWNDDGLDAPGRPVSGSSAVSSTDDRKDNKPAASAIKGERKKKQKPKKKKENICSRIMGCKY